MSKASVTTRTAFIIGDGSHLNFAKIIDGKVSAKRRKMWRAPEPQPPVEKLVVRVQSYATLKDDSNYQRRVSWLEFGPPEVLSRKLAIVEYDGQAPSSTGSHGISKRVQRQYKQTTERVMEQLCTKVATKTPIDV